MLAPLWPKLLKEGTISAGKLVHMGTTVVEMVKGKQYKSGEVNSCGNYCGRNG
jgi:hypothetical protein